MSKLNFKVNYPFKLTPTISDNAKNTIHTVLETQRKIRLA